MAVCPKTRLSRTTPPLNKNPTIIMKPTYVSRFFHGIWRLRTKCIALTIAGLHSLPAVAEPATKPNILVIISDDLGYADTGFQGSKDITTPNLDALAQAGIRFTSGYVTAPICGPSRAALITGRVQNQPQPWPARDPKYTPIGLDLKVQTMANYLSAAGYRCGALGKWHLGEEKHFHPLSRGFHEFYGFLGGAHGYYTADDTYWGQVLRNWEPVPKLEGYMTDVLGEEAVKFVTKDSQKPFFLYLAFSAVHAPYNPPPGADPNFNPEDKTERPTRRGYGAMTTSMDSAIGRVLAALEKSGQKERTLIFFLSDNGGPVRYGPGTIGASNLPLGGEKLELREGGIRVPFVMSWPGMLPSGKVDNQPIVSLDILPTALAAAGVAIDPAWRLEGVNLLPYLTGKNDAAPHQALCWNFPPQRAIRKGPWKLVKWTQPGQVPLTDWQLYNLDEDIGETRDQASVHPEIAEQLKKQWEDWNKTNVK